MFYWPPRVAAAIFVNHVRSHSKQYAIRFSSRAHNILKRDEVIKQVAALIGPRHKVNLTTPDKVILIEVFQVRRHSLTERLRPWLIVVTDLLRHECCEWRLGGHETVQSERAVRDGTEGPQGLERRGSGREARGGGGRMIWRGPGCGIAHPPCVFCHGRVYVDKKAGELYTVRSR